MIFQVTVPVRCQWPGGLGRVLQKVLYSLRQYLVYGTVSPTTRIYGSSDQGMKKETVPLTVMSSDPLGKILFHVPPTLISIDLIVLVPEEGNEMPQSAATQTFL